MVPRVMCLRGQEWSRLTFDLSYSPHTAYYVSTSNHCIAHCVTTSELESIYARFQPPFCFEVKINGI